MIGEFVVCFQEIENRFREIGWLILDPHRRVWPPKALRKETNVQLINEVMKLYTKLVDSLNIEDSVNRKKSFAEAVIAYQGLRRYRNNLLHSAYIELKAGGEVKGILRSNPKLKIDSETCDLVFDQEVLSEDAIQDKMRKLLEVALLVDHHYVQLIHWAPFDSLKKSESS